MNDRVHRFCTYFDSNYLLKGLALYDSLERHAPGFELTVLGLDDPVCRALQELRLPRLRVLPLEELEARVPGLRLARSNRSLVEYYFTCTSSFVRHLVERDRTGTPITYLDADLWFFSGLEPLFEEFDGHSIMIVAHRFPPALERLESYGIYNVGWITFASDDAARECLAWWSERCLEWCYDRVEEGRYADQKYLDEWPTRFTGVHVLSHPGANVAPWNVATHPVSVDETGVRVGRAPLVFFHFAGFKRLTPWLYDPGLASYGAPMTPALRRAVFEPYIAELCRIEGRVREQVPWFEGRMGSIRRPGWRALLPRLLRGQLLISREPG